MKPITRWTMLSAMLLTTLLAAASAWAQEAAKVSTLAKMPVKEVTVFKDGHAFMLHEGSLATDADGNVAMDYLPTPVLGTFWPYSSDKNATLQSVVASRDLVNIERTAMSISDLIRANLDSDVIITEVVPPSLAASVRDAAGEPPAKSYPAHIISILTRTTKELQAAGAITAEPPLPQVSNIVLLKTEEGIKPLPIDQIRDITFKNPPKTSMAFPEIRNLLTLKLDWKGKPQPKAAVGMMYLQKGIRWIPNYKVDIDGKGTATIKLQATIINEITDLDDVSMHLVVGVPTFKFEGEIDPMGLQQQLAQLSPYFTSTSRMSNFRNAQMTQLSNAAVSYGGDSSAPPAAAGPELGSNVANTGGREDLFVFDLKNVTLKKGQRAVMTIAEFKLPYVDTYGLEVPFTPPGEVWGSVMNQMRNSGGDIQLTRLMLAPKVMHKIRLSNDSKLPLTTAPALILQNGRLVAQGQMFYTSPGQKGDLVLTTAIDISVEKKEKETGRTPNALNLGSYNVYTKVNLEGTIKLTNRKDKPVKVDVTRYVLGTITEADEDATILTVNSFEDPSFVPPSMGDAGGGWWRWYGWPDWWYNVNSIGKASWTVDIEPGKSVELHYTWHYYWKQ